MDIHDNQRIKEIRDNTAKMADAFTRIADALERLADRKTEPTISKMEQVDKPSGYCNECKWYGDKQVCGRCRSRNLYAPKTEPQIDIHGLTDCDFCKERNCEDCEGGKDEPQTEEWYTYQDEQEYNDRWQTDCQWK